jgi:hypothetical protein
MKSTILILLNLFIFTLAHASNERKNRITIFDLGYSTATKGFVSLGYSREIFTHHLVSAYWNSLSSSGDPSSAYGINYKYFLKQETTSTDSWFLSGNLQSGGFYKGNATHMTILSASGGYQWIYESPFGITLEAGANTSDLGSSNLTLFKANFTYLF